MPSCLRWLESGAHYPQEDGRVFLFQPKTVEMRPIDLCHGTAALLTFDQTHE